MEPAFHLFLAKDQILPSKEKKEGVEGGSERRRGGSLVKPKGFLETGPQHGVAQRRKNTSFDVLRVSGVKAEFEMSWACSGDTGEGQMDSFPGKIIGSLGHWRLSSRRKGLMVTCYPHSFSFWLVWAPVLSSSWKHFVNRLYTHAANKTLRSKRSFYQCKLT